VSDDAGADDAFRAKRASGHQAPGARIRGSDRPAAKACSAKGGVWLRQIATVPAQPDRTNTSPGELGLGVARFTR
jgi:hypothetical protein